ncbi:Uncharacterised protein [Mycobacteroides abscessus subsp. abscessus]|nr:Uncharacterised protein [Mycobacteroides abscessus subsp. abscessus]
MSATVQTKYSVPQSLHRIQRPPPTAPSRSTPRPGTPRRAGPDDRRSTAGPRSLRPPARCAARVLRPAVHARPATGGPQRYACRGPAAPVRTDPADRTGASSWAAAHQPVGLSDRAPRSPRPRRPYTGHRRNRASRAAIPAHDAYLPGPPSGYRGYARSVLPGTPATGAERAHRTPDTRRPAPPAPQRRNVPCDADCPPSSRRP